MIALERDLVAQALLAGVRVEQRNPMLVLASLHLAALRGHPVLAPIYADARHGLITDHVAAADVVVGALNREPELVRSELHRSHADERTRSFRRLPSGDRAHRPTRLSLDQPRRRRNLGRYQSPLRPVPGPGEGRRESVDAHLS